MEWGSLIGLLLAFGGIIAGLLIEGGHLESLLQTTAFLIVFAGTVGAVLLQCGLENFIFAIKMTSNVFLPQYDDKEACIRLLTALSLKKKREGILSLEHMVDDIDDDFCRQGMRLIVDNTDPDKVKSILEYEINSQESRYKSAGKVWDAAGGYAPTIGILGAVLGLIHVMENLSDPSKLGSGIAVAFVATIYGVGLANLIFLPIANNLKKYAARKINHLEMISDAIVSIGHGDNQIVVEARMRAH